MDTAAVIGQSPRAQLQQSVLHVIVCHFNYFLDQEQQRKKIEAGLDTFKLIELGGMPMSDIHSNDNNSEFELVYIDVRIPDSIRSRSAE